MTRIALVPGTLALLPEYASLADPIADLRVACREAVAWLGAEPTVIADAQGARVAEAMVSRGVASVGGPPEAPARAYLVVGNGSATRTEKAPGYLDPRAEEFDIALEKALRTPDAAALRNLDGTLADELWAGTQCFGELADLLEEAGPAEVDFAAVPFGVQYWVMRWTIG